MIIKRQKKLLTGLILPLCLFSALGLSALETGKRIPEFQDFSWVKGEPQQIYKSHGDIKLIAIALFDSDSPQTQGLFRILNTLSDKYRAEMLSIAVSRDASPRIKQLLESVKTVKFPIASDVTGKSFKTYVENDPVLPKILLLDADGKLLWEGQPTELEDVAQRVLGGKFDIKTQKLIAAYRTEMHAALRSGLSEVVIKCSDKILALNLRDGIAIRARLFVYEQRSQMDEALKFMNSLIEKDPDFAEFHLIRIELALRSGKFEDLPKYLELTKTKFQTKPDNLSRAVWMILEGVPYSYLPLKELLDVANIAYEKTSNTEDKAIATATLARCWYASGNLPNAIKFQQEAVKLSVNTDFSAETARILNFYQNAASLSSQR